MVLARFDVLFQDFRISANIMYSSGVFNYDAEEVPQLARSRPAANCVS